MCLTIPKKVIDIKEDFAVVEDFNGRKQELKSIIDINKGDYVLSQQNMIIEKIDRKQAKETIDILKEDTHE